MTKLKLSRPIVFLDIESTGLDTQTDRIVELCVCKVSPQNEYTVKTYRYNPGIAIPEAATAIHGITNEDVKDCPAFSQHAKGILAFLEGCDIAGYNSNNYDLPLLYSELTRAGVEWDWRQHHLIDVGNIFKIKEERTLAAATKFYCNRELESAHSAEADVIATAEVFFCQLERYDDMPDEVEALARFSNYDKPMLDMQGKFTTDEDGDVIFTFGKHRGNKAKHHIDFCEWMAYKATFPKDTVDVAMRVINGLA